MSAEYAEKWDDEARKQVEKQERARRDAAAAKPWPELIALKTGSEVPFPVQALPVGMAAAVEEVAVSVNVDPAIPATAFLGVAASVIGLHLTLQVNPTWEEPCNLYVAVVASSGDGKTPGTSPAREPLYVIEERLRAQDGADKVQAKVMIPILRAQLDAIVKSAKAGTGQDQDKALAIQTELDRWERIARRDARFVVDDVTPERLAEILADNDGRITAFNDEGAMYHHALGRYARTPNLDSHLKPWDGNPLTVDRKGGAGTAKTAIYVPHPLMTMISVVQPSVIREFGSRRDLIDKGYLARCLIAFPTERVGYRMLSDSNLTPYEAVPAWNAKILAFAEAMDSERTIGLNPQAWQAFTIWRNQVEVGLRPGGVYRDVKTFAPKITTSILRVAALFAWLDASPTVTEAHVARGILLGNYYLAHARAVMETWAGSAVADADKVINKLNHVCGCLACHGARTNRVRLAMARPFTSGTSPVGRPPRTWIGRVTRWRCSTSTATFVRSILKLGGVRAAGGSSRKLFTGS